MIPLLVCLVVAAPMPFPYAHDFLLHASRPLSEQEVTTLIYPCPLVSLRELDIEVKFMRPCEDADEFSPNEHFYIARIRSEDVEWRWVMNHIFHQMRPRRVWPRAVDISGLTPIPQ